MDCLTVHCSRHWCTCGGTVNHATNICPDCGKDYSGEVCAITTDDGEPYRYNDDRDITFRRLGRILDSMEF